ncbi:hypothetical protein SAMN03159489_02826 [Pseudomonas sp. NFPP07]|uniref:hypothetical protein n=1 Tax=Pseudomonas sp. NFPP07 TaxID=1566213 RepID=UPI0008E81436|nr:hypothetical protein [Pseudomonas sp. NFPP07]SFQ22070.1 hypothetical protein SAMN03159489_02826 [Pseudomonas sp. NFPP07]
MKETTKELRSNFEKRVQAFLTSELSGYSDIRVAKNKITIKQKKSGATATLHLEYLTNSRAYEIIVFVEHPALQSEIALIEPPYSSNLPGAKFVYSMSTVSERDACPLLPVTEKGIEDTCQVILSRIKNVYIPVVFNLFDVKLELIDDIISRPKYYSYPFLLILIAMKINNFRPDENVVAKILSEDVLGYTSNKELKMTFNERRLADYISE